jgi:hypothetical protein
MTDPTSLPNFPPPPEEHPLRGRVLDALQDLQYGPDLDPEGDVKFTAQQQQLFVRCLQGGQVDIMRTFGQWQISDSVPGDLLTRLNACNDVTLGVNLVKAGIAGGNLVLTIEQIIGKKENPKAKLQIAVGLLLQAVALWHKNAVAKSKREEALKRGEDPDAGAAEEEQGKVGPWLSEGVRRRQRGEGEEGRA